MFLSFCFFLVSSRSPIFFFWFHFLLIWRPSFNNILLQIFWLQILLVFLYLTLFLISPLFLKVTFAGYRVVDDNSLLLALGKCCDTSFWPPWFLIRKHYTLNYFFPRVNVPVFFSFLSGVKIFLSLVFRSWLRCVSTQISSHVSFWGHSALWPFVFITFPNLGKFQPSFL